MHFWAVLSGTPDWTKAWVSLYAPDFLLSADISDANDEVWVNLQENLFYHKREFVLQDTCGVFCHKKGTGPSKNE